MKRFVSWTAEAGDTKFYPATMCQGFVPQTYQSQIVVGQTPAIVPGVYILPATYATSGAALNPSSSFDMTVVCPVVRDVVRTDNLGWTSLIVNVLNLNHTKSLACSAQTFYPDDYGVGNASSNSLAPLHDWTDLPLSAMASSSDAYIVVSCALPVRDDTYPSGIASYRIDE